MSRFNQNLISLAKKIENKQERKEKYESFSYSSVTHII